MYIPAVSVPNPAVYVLPVFIDPPAVQLPGREGPQVRGVAEKAVQRVSLPAWP